MIGETIIPAIVGFISGQALLVAGIFLILAIALVRIINSDNPLAWWQFIASKGADGKQYADIDKLGKAVGIVVSSIVILIMAVAKNVDVMLFIAYLAYVGGVAGYSAYLRSKAGLPPQQPDQPPKP